MEPHGVVQGGLEVLLMLVGQRYCVKEAKVRDIGSHTAVHLDVAFPCNRSQPYSPGFLGFTAQDLQGDGEKGTAMHRHTDCSLHKVYV